MGLEAHQLLRLFAPEYEDSTGLIKVICTVVKGLQVFVDYLPECFDVQFPWTTEFRSLFTEEYTLEYTLLITLNSCYMNCIQTNI
jgi:hypothetical protein